MLDLILAIAHHLAVFAVAGLLVAELVLLRPGIAGERLRQLGGVDAAYGATATLVIVVGILRVFFGDAGAGYYAANWVFWTKMALFALVGIISIRPTIAFARWRRAVLADPTFAPPAEAVATHRRSLHLEVAIFFLIPVAAAAMARGYGS